MIEEEVSGSSRKNFIAFVSMIGEKVIRSSSKKFTFVLLVSMIGEQVTWSSNKKFIHVRVALSRVDDLSYTIGTLHDCSMKR